MLQLVALALVCFCVVHAGRTTVSVGGTQFYINGKVSNPGTPAAGLLLNSKMSQAIFDDENQATSSFWKYPDTRSWNATRNTLEFVSNMSLFNSKGLNAITVGMQGSDPDPSNIHNKDCIVSAYTQQGQLKSQWISRLSEVIKAADQNGMVVILTLFDLSQEGRLNGDDGTIVSAVQSVVQLLVQQGASNVILDLADSCSNAYTHSMLTPNSIPSLIKMVKVVAPHILVSTSFPPGVIPPDNVVESVDFILLHATGLNRTGLETMVQKIKTSYSYRRNSVPIIINEDSADIGNLAQAVSDGVSWGFFSQGLNDYMNGYCSPPVNWGINTIDKRTFFDEVSLLTQSKN